MSTSVVSLEELLDLGISGTDVGCVNFNIIRLILRDLIRRTSKIDKSPVALGEFESNLVSNYKSYIQGDPVSPMPGVVRLADGTVSKKGPLGQSPRPPQAPRPGAPPLPPSTGSQTQGGQTQQSQGSGGGQQRAPQQGSVPQQGQSQSGRPVGGQPAPQGGGQGGGGGQRGPAGQGQQGTQGSQPGVTQGTQAGAVLANQGTQAGQPGGPQQSQPGGAGQASGQQAKPGAPQVQQGSPQAQSGAPPAQPGQTAQQGPSGQPLSQPDQPQSQSGQPQGQPGAPQVQTGTPQAQQGAPQAQPGAQQAQPGQPQGQPGSPQGQRGAAQAQPSAPQAQPEAPQGQPKPPTPQQGGSTPPGSQPGTTPPAQQPAVGGQGAPASPKKGGPSQSPSGTPQPNKQGTPPAPPSGGRPPAPAAAQQAGQASQPPQQQTTGQSQVEGGRSPLSSRGPGTPVSPVGNHGQSSFSGERHRTHEVDHGFLKELQDRIIRMEEVMYDPSDPSHPSHRKTGTQKHKEDEMAPSDMWQLVNLNNRIAAAEAAIQKMAGLVDNMSSRGGHPSSGEEDRRRRRRKEGEGPDSGGEHHRLSPKRSPDGKPKKGAGGSPGFLDVSADSSQITNQDSVTGGPSRRHKDTESTGSGSHRKDGGSGHQQASQRKSQGDKGAQSQKEGRGSQGRMVDGEESERFQEGEQITETSERRTTTERGSHSEQRHHKGSHSQETDAEQLGEGGESTRKSMRSSGQVGRRRSDGATEATGYHRPSQVRNLTESQIDLLSPEEQMQVRILKQQMGEPSFNIDLEQLTAEEVAQIPVSDLRRMTPSQVRGLSVEVRANMTPEQLQMLDEILQVEREHYKDISRLTREEIEHIPQEVLDSLSPEIQQQMKEIQRDIEEHKPPEFDELDPTEVATIRLSTLDRLTPDQVAKISDEVKSHMTPQQLAKLEEILEAGQHYKRRDSAGDDLADASVMTLQEGKGGKKKRPVSKKHRKHRGKKDEEGQAGEQTPPEIPKPKMGAYTEILTMEGYLASLRKEDIENMASGAIQDIMRKQYAQLQGLQNKLTKDIQDKMEIVYQRLLREIITQQLTSSPYNVLDSGEKCPGPGICKGHGMPAGIAVCQYPEITDSAKKDLLKPDDASCPTCGMGNADLKNLKPPAAPKPKRSETPGAVAPFNIDKFEIQIAKDGADTDDAIREMRSLVSLDLDAMQRAIQQSDVGEFDEKDILERLETLWAAVKVIKVNEESLATKIAKQEILMKASPSIKAEGSTADLLMTKQYSFGAVPTIVEPPASAVPRMSLAKGDDGEVRTTSADREDIQTLFTNLANVIGECADQKDRIDQLMDTVRIIESGMVTKVMMTDAMSDKADRGQINSKVSYDEFGNTVDELHNQLHNLMVEGYQRNETWKKVTADLAEELAEKLDKVELAPVRAFFKNRLKKLEDRVLILSTILEEPDPAGTRKKLLKNYNCISCDRRVNISGITNTSTLPQLPAQLVSSSTAARRTFDLHHLRSQRTRQEAEIKEVADMEQQIKRMSQNKRMSGRGEGQLNEKDVMQAIKRYSGQERPTGTGALPTYRRTMGSQQSTAVRASQGEQRKSLHEQMTRVSENQVQITKQESKPQLQDLLMGEEDEYEEEYLEFYEEEEGEEAMAMGQEE